MGKLSENYSCFANGSNDTAEYQELQVVIGGPPAVLCGIVMVLIVCLKAYKTFIDRLVLYIILSEFLCSVVMILQVVSQTENKVGESVFNGVCDTVAYLTTLTFWMVILFLMVISLHHFFLVAFQVRVSKYEKLIVVGIPIMSAVVATIPFMTKSYDSSSGLCWVKLERHLSSHNQNIAGFAEQIGLGYGPPMLVAAFNLFTAAYVAWVICWQRGARRQHMEAVKETIHLVLYPIIDAVAGIIGLANLIDFYVNDCQPILWWLSAASVPIAGIVTTLALLFHVVLTEHRRRKRKRQWTESETRHVVPPEFPSEVDPLVITGVRPREPETAYKSIYLTDTIN